MGDNLVILECFLPSGKAPSLSDFAGFKEGISWTFREKLK